MRIAQVCPYFHPHVGGVESHVLDISRELRRRGHEVTVLTSRHAPLPLEEEVEGLPVHRVPVLFTLFRSPVTPDLNTALEDLPADLYHAHSPPPVTSYYAARAAERTGVPLAVTYHCDLEIPGPWGPVVTGLYRRTLEAYTMARATGVVATTQTYAATSRSLWRLDPAVIPNAVDARRFRPGASGEGVRARLGIGPDAPLVLFVGRLVRHKGIEHLLEALTRVEARLLVVGTGDFEAPLRRWAATLGVGEKVAFVGRVPPADLPAHYAAADLFVLPSISRLEAFGIAALEAMASGTPVVVSNVPGIREVIDDGVEGLLAEPMNPGDLATKMRTLLEDPERRRAMGERGRRKVEAVFSVERVVDRLERLYAKVQSTTRSS